MKPKVLTFAEMCKLYELLGRGRDQKFLLDEISTILSSTPPDKVQKAINLIYGKNVPLKNPIQLAVLFTQGLTYNKFFDFQTFVEALNGSTK